MARRDGAAPTTQAGVPHGPDEAVHGVHVLQLLSGPQVEPIGAPFASQSALK